MDDDYDQGSKYYLPSYKELVWSFTNRVYKTLTQHVTRATKIVLQLSVLKATGFLSQLREQGRRWGRKMEIAQGAPCLQVADCTNSIAMPRRAEAPPTRSWLSHVRRCSAGILLGYCLKVTHWSAATCASALLTQRSRLYKFNSSAAYLMGDNMQIYRRRKERMSFIRQALLSFSHYYHDFS